MRSGLGRVGPVRQLFRRDEERGSDCWFIIGRFPLFTKLQVRVMTSLESSGESKDDDRGRAKQEEAAEEGGRDVVAGQGGSS